VAEAAVPAAADEGDDMREIACLLAAVAAFAQQSSSSSQRGFATAEEAGQALAQAASDFNVPALIDILGPASKDLVTTEDPIADKSRALEFARLAHEKLAVSTDPKSPNRVELLAGNDAWPLPIPLVKRKGSWYFDSKSARQEILYRRIGQNELDAIQVCRGFVEAQREYALEKHGDVRQYAQRIISSPGMRDGLAWQNPDGSWGGPVGEAVAKALSEGYQPGIPPYHGYYFKVLKGQGPAAPLGELDFVIEGIMIGGFALAAVPAQYRVTGVQTFIVSHDGIVYQKDLGPDTLTIFKTMERYNPDKTWRVTEDSP
jgi:hypothetical protein